MSLFFYKHFYNFVKIRHFIYRFIILFSIDNISNAFDFFYHYISKKCFNILENDFFASADVIGIVAIFHIILYDSKNTDCKLLSIINLLPLARHTNWFTYILILIQFHVYCYQTLDKIC